MIPKDTIEKIFDAADIVDVIGEFVNLKKAGSNFKGLSPFINEKTPSFSVSPAKGIFKDFSSGKGGNVVSFLMEHEHFSYPEALRWLAKRYNIEIEEEKLTPEKLEAQNTRESLYLVNQFARDYFVKQIKETQEGKAIGLSYFKERGFSQEIIKKFELGYSPETKDAFTKAALSSGYKLEYLEQVGLTKSSERGSFDFYRGRVMFPIHNLTGRVLGFGGRTLRSDKSVAKYFNSPESEIYNKSKILYGLYFAKNAIIKEDQCYLVEGYTDVISMHQSGIENVVASSGTALTEGQIRLIKRYTPNITILYDGDAAGIKASFRGIDLILAEGMNVQVILFPEGEDPDSYSKSVSEDEFQTFLDQNKKDFIRFKTEALLSDTGNDPLKRAETIKEIVKSIAVIPDAIVRSVYCKETSQIFDIAEKTVISEVNKLLSKGNKIAYKEEEEVIPIQEAVKPKSPKGKHSLAEQEKDLIRLMLNYGDIAIEIEAEDDEGKEILVSMPLAQFITEELLSDELAYTNEVYQHIFEEFIDGIDNQLIVNANQFLQQPDPKLSEIVTDLTISKDSVSENWTKRHQIFPQSERDKLKDAAEQSVSIFKLRYTENSIHEKQLQLKDNNEENQLILLLEEIKELIEIRNFFADKLGIIITR